jgi:hypothetical protein
MGWMQFVNAIVGHVLSWPIFGVVAVIVFRRQLAPLMHRIASYEGLGQKLTFGQELAKVEEQAGDLASSQPQDLLPAAQSQPVGTEEEHYALLAEQAPAGAIIDAWVRVEKAVISLAEVYDIGDIVRQKSYKKFGKPSMNPRPAQMIGTLTEQRLVPITVIRVIEGLRRLRNEVAHGAHDPTAGEAITYATTAREVWELLDRLVSFANKDSGAEEAGAVA